MLTQGGGVIVNNASVSGLRNPKPGLSLDAASKAAAISLTRSAAMEYAPAGIRINAISPGRVVTPMLLGSKIADMSAVPAGLPLPRMGPPEEVAEAVLWLASDAARSEDHTSELQSLMRTSSAAFRLKKTQKHTAEFNKKKRIT